MVLLRITAVYAFLVSSRQSKIHSVVGGSDRKPSTPKERVQQCGVCTCITGDICFTPGCCRCPSFYLTAELIRVLFTLVRPRFGMMDRSVVLSVVPTCTFIRAVKMSETKVSKDSF